ncbi:MAG TPA: HIT family protein [Alcanivoracaceae bacterium]|nr:HIT family protein [Alcanivoracaceae bacterium]
MSDCIFCHILAGDMPAAVVYEDDKAMVILDLFPVSEGHALVISRQHSASIQGLPQEDLEHMLRLVRATMAAQEKVDPSITAQNLLINDRPDANQHIPHVHWHVIPRRKGDNLRSLWQFYTRLLNRFGLQKRQAKHQALAARLREHFPDTL